MTQDTSYQPLTKLRAYLSQFVSISDKEWETISESFTVQNFEKDISLLGNGQACRSMFYLCSGITRSYAIDENGRDFTTCFHFNEPSSTVKNLFLTDFSSVIRNEPSQLHFQTLTEVQAVELPTQAISELYERGAKWEKLGRRLSEEAYYHTQQRAMSLLMKTAKQRYAELCEQMPHLIESIPEYYVASYLGITPQSLSRIKS
ncbi:putative cAMP-binding protein [Vibrio nigripulchritudo SFn27]|uniref:Putative cAMP-binding protein n=1 Tax=Vibrio nigripulchritudo TaxID=28173 RepID=U4KCC8_9VIBR|nr:Crp/Fnr family transcriptional regulator [Vibrio nigripulchritudo]CCN81254.1 putative cAMP-binding protein [Vibrio nigripulchritudo BLFn1]CCN86577.1 putative cAMP-binding protein [Vibrio nigripulchritudo SFn27]CCN97176.1 putative cAMP-binding protein [Vibrio nigripulchritudo ENn2]CCO42991.1 putative cAMP-binding protein [Vibrio nigripulchritudo SFn135]CCO50627.1 putative cAMP-binding protein [Vibrio nigripulchritudo Wn13]